METARPDSFTEIFKNLSFRKFTKEADLLEAFAGIGEYLTKLYDWSFYYGLAEEVLNVALLLDTTNARYNWTSLDGLPKEVDKIGLLFDTGEVNAISQEIFPTWSWAGWKPRAFYSYSNNLDNDSYGKSEFGSIPDHKLIVNKVTWRFCVKQEQGWSHRIVQNSGIRNVDTKRQEDILHLLHSSERSSAEKEILQFQGREISDSILLTERGDDVLQFITTLSMDEKTALSNVV
jgi:hypothetical protein